MNDIFPQRSYSLADPDYKQQFERWFQTQKNSIAEESVGSYGLHHRGGSFAQDSPSWPMQVGGSGKSKRQSIDSDLIQFGDRAKRLQGELASLKPIEMASEDLKMPFRFGGKENMVPINEATIESCDRDNRSLSPK